ncbi:cupin domain-containing protein [Aliikangiella sp. IMCC44359]|uniref:cupin domain-containing protein n=1 Tax=Aliikangiella sp. IMCC44359 TaxID=3459125 RepID=UPI00403AE6AE
MTKEEIIEKLKLELHLSEGGYFKRTYESELNIGECNSERKLLTSIYYMLTNDNPIGYLHRNKSDIIHFYHLGSPIKYMIVTPEGKIVEKILGPDISQGERPQLIVKGGYWKASQLCSGEYGLISEAVSPGFDYADNEVASLEVFTALHPIPAQCLSEYIKQ